MARLAQIEYRLPVNSARRCGRGNRFGCVDLAAHQQRSGVLKVRILVQGAMGEFSRGGYLSNLEERVRHSYTDGYVQALQAVSNGQRPLRRKILKKGATVKLDRLSGIAQDGR